MDWLDYLRIKNTSRTENDGNDTRKPALAERSHRIDDEEFYQMLDQGGISDDIYLFNEKVREWEDYYNYHRPHGALGGLTPFERLMEKTRAGVSQGS
jgi:transposase InsO family protein